jgi:hypothetical protein
VSVIVLIVLSLVKVADFFFFFALDASRILVACMLFFSLSLGFVVVAFFG